MTIHNKRKTKQGKGWWPINYFCSNSFPTKIRSEHVHELPKKSGN